ncbi:MAG TPA: alginate export family protein [Candidatus Polarisedimenticolia bacterium]|nr:alginate export family protein [Candidatus Polarisedimenticolia bacterium]
MRVHRIPRALAHAARGAALATALLLVTGLAFPAEDGGEVRTLRDALEKGEVGLSLRYRAERVTDEAPAVADNVGVASTLRTTLSYRTAPLIGFSAFLQFEDVSNLGYSDAHNDTVNGIVDHPVIADPQGTDVEQAYLRYALPKIVDVRAGRIALSLGQERYVGPVGWRQNQQSFDAAEIDLRAIPRTTVRLVYIDKVLRIFGDSRRMHSPLVDAEVRVGRAGVATAYYYDLDYSDLFAAGGSTATTGARWQNTWDLPGEWSIPYLAEYARQKDAGDNPSALDVQYVRWEIGAKRKSLQITAGQETLGGDAQGGAFSTPLATLHKWNGWADKFLVTPPNGLEDTYLSAGYGWEGWTGTVVWHDFRSDSRDMNYGSEIDALVEWKAPWKQIFAAKAALYDASDFAADTGKYWIYTAWSM